MATETILSFGGMLVRAHTISRFGFSFNRTRINLASPPTSIQTLERSIRMRRVIQSLRQDRLRILLDSSSILTSDRNTEKLLSYSGSDLLRFLLSPDAPVSVAGVEEVLATRDANGHVTSISVPVSGGEARMGFGYSPQTISLLAAGVFSHSPPTSDDKCRITLGFVLELLTGYGDVDFMVTNDSLILNDRDWFQTMNKCSIVSVEEALEIIDVFAKRKGVYFLSGQYDVGSSWYWYWCSFRSKVPHYNVSTDILAALANRFTNVLMAIDEMGFQYYLGADNDTMENTMYHFKHFIALVCGIFDSLAIETRDRLHVVFKDDHIPSRTSLDKSAADEFLKKLKVTDPNLWGLIDKHRDFIRVIHRTRQSVIHTRGLLKSGFHYDSGNGKTWVANVVDLSKDIDVFKDICSWTTGTKPFEPLTDWGIYNGHNRKTTWTLLSPYDFAKAATRKLAEFCDSYLELLGFPDYVGTPDPRNPLLDDIKMLRAEGIGF
jgi:hypothetical protein